MPFINLDPHVSSTRMGLVNCQRTRVFIDCNDRDLIIIYSLFVYVCVCVCVCVHIHI